MLKVGLAGAWHVHFDGYAKSVKANEGCKITRLWEENEEAGRAAAEKFECEYFSDYDTFLSSEVEAIIVSSSTNLHPEIIIKAAEKGIHIFTEKVLCFTKEDALKIEAAVKKSGIKFCISFPFRCRGDLQWIKKALDEKLIGEVTYARMRNAHSGASDNWLPASFYDPVTCGGGAMMDLGAHPMYLLNWFMGKPKAIQSTFTHYMVESVEDNAVSVLEYANGAIGVSETGFVSDNNPSSLEFTGTKGSIFCGGPGNQLCYNNGEGWEEPDPLDSLDSPINIFLNAVINDTDDIPFTIEDAVALTETMEAAYKSSKSNAKYILE